MKNEKRRQKREKEHSCNNRNMHRVVNTISRSNTRNSFAKQEREVERIRNNCNSDKRSVLDRLLSCNYAIRKIKLEE